MMNCAYQVQMVSPAVATAAEYYEVIPFLS